MCLFEDGQFFLSPLPLQRSAMFIAHDMPRIPALQRSAMCDVSCIVGVFIYGIKSVLPIASTTRSHRNREYNSLPQESRVQLAPTGIASTTRSYSTRYAKIPALQRSAMYLFEGEQFFLSPLPLQRSAMSIAHHKPKCLRSSGAQCVDFILLKLLQKPVGTGSPHPYFAKTRFLDEPARLPLPLPIGVFRARWYSGITFF